MQLANRKSNSAFHMNFFCIINPFSGGKHGQFVLSRLQYLFAHGVFQGKAVESSLANLREQIAQAKNYDCLIVGGGDGTIANALQVLDDLNVPIGIIPLGTANDLARELGITKKFCHKEPEKLLQMFETANTKAITLWQLSYGADYSQSLLFSNYVSLGFDGAVMKSVAWWRKKHEFIFKFAGKLGTRVAYGLAALRHLANKRFSAPHLLDKTNQAIAVTRKPIRTLLIANIRCIAGLGKSNSIGSGFDNALEILLLSSVWQYLHFLCPKLPKPFSPYIVQLQDSLKILDVPPNTHFQVDGEDIAELTGQNIKICLARKQRVFTSKQ